MSTTQASTRYSYIPSDQQIWANSLEMGKKGNALRKLARQQAKQAKKQTLLEQNSAQDSSPFVGQALLDALEGESSPHVGQALSNALEQQLAIDLKPSGGLTSEKARATNPRPVKKPVPHQVLTQPGAKPSLPPRPAPGHEHKNRSAAAPSLAPNPASSRYKLRSKNVPPAATQNNVGVTGSNGQSYYPTEAHSVGTYGMGNHYTSQTPPQAQFALNPQASLFQPYYGQAPGGGVWLNPQGFLPQQQQQIFQHPAQYHTFDPLRSVQSYNSGHCWRIDKNLRFSKAHSTLTTPFGVPSPFGAPSPFHTSTSKPKDKYAAAAAQRAAKRAAAQAIPGQAVPQHFSFRSPTPERSPTPSPVPVPQPGYLSQAFCEPTTLSSPQPMLFILDLNGTLLHRPNRKNPTRFISRPFVSPFLAYLFANFTVMVWSSARPENVSMMCSQLFTPAQRACIVAQ